MQSVPELYPSFSMPLEPDLRKEESETRCLHLVLNKKTTLNQASTAAAKGEEPGSSASPKTFNFCFHFLLDLISAQNGQFRVFKPKQTPLFSRPQIPGLEMCFQISTIPAWLVVKETWKLGLNTKRELAFRFLPKPSDLTPFFFFPFLSSFPKNFRPEVRSLEHLNYLHINNILLNTA